MIDFGYRIRALLFDFDGTLTAPGAIDFDGLRRELECPAGMPLLEYIEGLPEAALRNRARQVLDRHEEQAAAVSRPQPDAEEFLEWCQAQGLKIGIISRNSRGAVERALQNFHPAIPDLFSVILTRDDPVAPKPDPAGVLLAARLWLIAPAEILVVGDYHFDIQAGRRAGALTAFLDNHTGYRLRHVASDVEVSNLMALLPVVRAGLPLGAGKLPLKLLQNCLEDLIPEDPALIIHPAIGEDIAAVQLAGEEVLVLKSDPITFATDAIAWYAVVVNANDIATSGAVPRWLLTTLLFPLHTTPSQVHAVMRGLQEACRRWHITLCGGHTEITDAVTRPVISGMLCGTVVRKQLIDKRRIHPGDHIWLTKALAVEGTSIIAREFEPRLRELGLAAGELAECRALLDQISILPEAGLAAAVEGVSGMHDVTEGGLAGALEELSLACGQALRVDLDVIPVMELTRRLCRLLNLDPLGLIGSGSLLICCRPGAGPALESALQRAAIPICRIGTVLPESQPGIQAHRKGKPAQWPRFETDEITRLFSASSA